MSEFTKRIYSHKNIIIIYSFKWARIVIGIGARHGQLPRLNG
jgi:hypothetical protein